MWLNEHEIDDAYDTLSAHAPEAAPYARYLRDWKDVVNSNSDGWAYWKSGSRPADGLGTLVKQAVDSLRGRGAMPSETDFKKSLSPIKAAATRFKLEAPTLDLDAAPAPRF